MLIIRKVLDGSEKKRSSDGKLGCTHGKLPASMDVQCEQKSWSALSIHTALAPSAQGWFGTQASHVQVQEGAECVPGLCRLKISPPLQKYTEALCFSSHVLLPALPLWQSLQRENQALVCASPAYDAWSLPSFLLIFQLVVITLQVTLVSCVPKKAFFNRMTGAL